VRVLSDAIEIEMVYLPTLGYFHIPVILEKCQSWKNQPKLTCRQE